MEVMSLLAVNPTDGARAGRRSQTGPGASVHRSNRGRAKTLPELCRRFAARLRRPGGHALAFAGLRRLPRQRGGHGGAANAFGRVDWPVTWVQGARLRRRPVAGLQVHAFTGAVERVVVDGRVAGSVFTDGGARQCLVGGLMPADPALSRPDQTTRTLEGLQTVLAAAGFDLAEVVRTWFFLDQILSWYDDFNRARTKIYSGVKFRTGSLPASTGVGAANPAGAALALAAWAFRPLEPNCLRRGSGLAAAMSRPGLRQLVQPRHGNLHQRRPAAVHFRHRQHRARRAKPCGWAMCAASAS